MLEIVIDTVVDALKILPFLWLSFFIMEIIHHKLEKRSSLLFINNFKLGPIIGGILGVIPQCGFSVMVTNLYISGLVSIGTLISVYLSTSDEMLPLLIVHGSSFNIIIKIILLKVLIAVMWGFIIDFIFRKKNVKNELNYHEDNDDDNMLISSIKHTLNIFIYLIIFTFILNIIMHYGGEDVLRRIVSNNSIISYFISSLIGLIPNCCSSVILTELYLNNILSLPILLSGLLTGSGVAILVLFKSSNKLKDTLKILGIIYIIGVLSGVILGGIL